MHLKAILLVVAGLIVVLILIALTDFLIVKYNGTTVLAPTIPRQPVTTGSGPKLTYVVMGDSTSIGQGSDYPSSIGPKTTAVLANDHTVTYVNVGISGATVKSMREQELAKAVSYKPDVVLLSVGANDVTHLTKTSAIADNLSHVISSLIASNCNVKLVFTGSPEMGSVPRFPWPLKQYAEHRTAVVNATFESVISQHQLTFAPIAANTGSFFKAHPELFASDKFHPLAGGYAEWLPTLNTALAEALQSQPSHCSKD
jgi:lysophospholipase L1-like esterase